MIKLAGLFVLLAVFVAPVVAQDTQAPPEEQAPTAPTEPTEPVKVKHTYPTPKGEISGGFVYRGFYGPSATSIGMIGGYGSYEYTYRRWLAFEGDAYFVTGNLKIPRLPPEGLHVFTGLAGPKVYPLGRHRIDPFGHFNYGAAVLLSSVPAFSGYPGSQGATAVRAWQAGGGVEVNIKSHWAVRAVQLDYESANFLGSGVPNQSSKRVSFGVVYHLGEK